MKKQILAILVLTAGLTLGLPLQAATLKIATVTPENSQWMKDMRASAKEIKERTEGRVQIKYYGGGIMGNDQKVLSRIRIGALQGGAFTPTALAGQYSNLNLYGLPMLFDSEEEAAFARSRLDAKLSAGLEKAGFVNFGFAAGGFADSHVEYPGRFAGRSEGQKGLDSRRRRNQPPRDGSDVTLPGDVAAHRRIDGPADRPH